MAGIIAGNSPVLGPRGGATADPHTIVNIADDGFGNALMTTAAPHGLVGGEFIAITGNSVSGYNTTWGALETPNSETTILINTDGAPPQSFGTGGTWALV